MIYGMRRSNSSNHKSLFRYVADQAREGEGLAQCMDDQAWATP